MPVRLHVYEGDPPPDDVVSAAFLMDADYTYVVATAAQERLREALAPPRQRGSRFSPGASSALAASSRATYAAGTEDVHLTFPRMVRHVMGRACLTRSEERVLVRRAIGDVAATDEERIRLLHDVGPLTDALAELTARGIDLATAPAPTDESFTSPQLVELLRDLQAAMAVRVADTGMTAFEAAARAWIEGDPALGPCVVLDGFTFLTPLQRLLVERLSAGVDVVAIFPYRATQGAAFDVMERTYAPWWPPAPEPLTDVMPNSSALSEAKAQLFGTETRRIPADGSLQVRGYDHEHDEARACVQELARSVNDYGEHVADKVAIVTPFPHRYDALLQEELALQHLPVQVGIPPRLLLLTPVGRFVLTLYDIWSKEGIELTADQFERLLSSGWLGMRAQTSAAAFAAARQQVFARCRSVASWEQTLGLLPGPDSRPPPSSRLPTAHLEGHERDVWTEALRQVTSITTRLFSAGPGSIGEHVRRLLQEIKSLGGRELFAEEQAVVERIREALEEASTATTMRMETEEFGSILTGLAREYEEAALGEDDGRAPDGVRVWVTTPEGIDGYPKDVVILLGADELQIPRPFRAGWPVSADTLDEHLAKERYLFLSVVRAARRRLRVSYSRSADRGARGASPFLRAISAPALPRGVPPAAVARTPDGERAATLRPARRGSYGVSEIALFGLCPYRYKMERLSPLAQTHQETFQLRVLAQAEWLDALLRNLHGELLELSALRTSLAAAGRAVEADVKATIPGLRHLDWLNSRSYVRRALTDLVRWLSSRAPHGVSDVVFHRPAASGTSLDLGGREVRVHATVNHAAALGDIEEPVTNDDLWRTWIFPMGNPDEPEPSRTTVGGVPVFASPRHALQWWRMAGRTLFLAANTADTPAALPKLREELVSWVRTIESSDYPKRPGDHCRQCPVQNECFGLDAR